MIDHHHFAVLDVETTGFSARGADRVIEVGVVRVDGHGTVISEWSSLVDPQRDVGPTHVHGVSADDVSAAPTFGQVAGDLLEHLAGAVFVGHNARFDRGFIEAEYHRLGATLPAFPLICTMQMARRAALALQNYKLATCCEHFGIYNAGAHSALDDARATARLFAFLLDSARADGAATLAEIGCPEPVVPAAAWPFVSPSGLSHHRPATTLF